MLSVGLQIFILNIILIIKIRAQIISDDIEKINNLENILKNIYITNETNLIELPMIKAIDKYLNFSDFIGNIDLTTVISKDIKNYINRIKSSDNDFYNDNIAFFDNINNQLDVIDNSYSFEEKIELLKILVNDTRNKFENQDQINLLFNGTKINSTFDYAEAFLNYYEIKRRQKLDNDNNNLNTNTSENISMNYYNNTDFKGFNTKVADIFFIIILTIFVISLVIIAYYYIKEKKIVMNLGGESTFQKIKYYTNRKDNKIFIKVPLSYYNKEIEMINISNSSSQYDDSTFSS